MEERLKELKKRRSELNREYMSVCSEIEELEKKISLKKLEKYKSYIGKYIRYSWSIPEGDCGEIYAFVQEIIPFPGRGFTVKGKIMHITSEVEYISKCSINEDNEITEITKEEFDRLWNK